MPPAAINGSQSSPPLCRLQAPHRPWGVGFPPVRAVQVFPACVFPLFRPVVYVAQHSGFYCDLVLMVSGESSVEEIPSVVLLCYLWLPLLLASISFARLLLRLCRRSNSMDAFDLNEHYTHLDDSFVPSTQFDEVENDDPSIHLTRASDASRSPLQSLTNVNFGLSPPTAPAPKHARYSTLSIVHINALSEWY